MKKLLCFLFAVSVLSGCGEDYDDSALTGRVDDLENRVSKLEELCKQMNTNISSLQALVNALQDNDYITGVTPITKDGETIGYTISFAKSAPITIYHGEDGKDGQDGKPGEDGNDGSTPIIGVKQDTDGVYYWTLNGDWLTDDSGNKIQAEGRDGTDGKPGEDGNDGQDGKPGEDGNDGQDGQDGKPGEDGKDGITPQLKIEDGDWYVSYNDGASWTQLGKATGDKGEPGEPGQAGGIFKDVEETDDSVIFTLNDDSTITIPKATASETLDIVFGNTDSINVLPGKTYEIEYTITGADENTLIEVVAQDLYKASVSPTDYRSGKIIVTTPSADLGASRVLVFVSKGTNTIMRILNFVESVILVSTDTVEIAAEGETVQVKVETNVTYTVEIPEADRVWLSVAETRAATHTETLTFTAQANPNTTYRYSTVSLKDDSGLVAQSILFAQKASGYKTVHVETAGTLENYISADEKEKLIGLKLTGKLNTFDYDFMRTMPALESVDLAQIDNTTIPASCFKSSTIKTVILPLNLDAIPDNAFNGSRITSIEIPGTVLSIGASAFERCSWLAGNLVLPEGLQTIGERAFYQCKALTGSLHIPNSVTSLGAYAFYECSGFTGTLTFGSGITTIPEECFKGCSGFTGNLVIPDQVARIENYAFYLCTGFKGYLTIGRGISQIGSGVFCKSDGFYILRFTKVYCKATTPPNVSTSSFGSSGAYSYLGVPIGCKDAYDKDLWSDWFIVIEEIEF
ncbi:leucine-rich repeat protein [uncultured Alistipes sp.]|uniref:leucine-rich repeat protein n=1 Tax=uncultured Alistipes sp. TaxID=538949 RepID=UPI0026181149|nr:leucine-rich repeat protein [uncultured Alistipes sp.]